MGTDDHSDISNVGDHRSGLGMLSFRGIIAFFLSFRWAGVIALKAGLGLVATIAIGPGTGGVLMLCIFLAVTSANSIGFLA